MINPVNHARSPRRPPPTKWNPTSSPPMSMRAAAYRPRRLDMVHGLGRLDVPADRGIAPGAEPRSGQTALYAVPPRGLGGVQDALPLSGDGLPHRRQVAENALVEIKKLKDQLEAERAYLQEEIKLEYNHENIVGQSNAINYVFYKVEQIAGTDTNV
jgi:hypothetical protein